MGLDHTFCFYGESEEKSKFYFTFIIWACLQLFAGSSFFTITYHSTSGVAFTYFQFPDSGLPSLQALEACWQLRLCVLTQLQSR